MKTILLIDDDPGFIEITAEVLSSAGYEIIPTYSPSEAFPVLMDELADLVICDLHMPFTMGDKQNDYKYSYEVGIRTIKEIYWAVPHLPIIALTSAPIHDLSRIATMIDPIPAYSKPASARKLVDLVYSVLEHKEALAIQ